MAYEVTKRINGHDYRYIVEAYRDPQTNRRKTRWRYAGAVENGEVRKPVPRPHRITRDDIIAATASLLAFRDPEHITIGVIAAAARTSRSAFYRYFHNQQEAMDATVDYMAKETSRNFPSLQDKPRDLQEAKAQLRRWCGALSGSRRLQNMIERVLRQEKGKRARLRIKRPKGYDDSSVPLSLFLQQLNDAGFAAIPDPLALARAIKGMHLAQRVAQYLAQPEHYLPLADFEEMYTLIERAVFGLTVARSVSLPTDRRNVTS